MSTHTEKSPPQDLQAAGVLRSRTEEGSIAIIIPIFNEVANLDELVAKLVSALEPQDFSWRVLFVDDGSRDGSLARLKQLNKADGRFIAISLSRNFGKEMAITAGLRHAVGDAVVVMDGDLQHPPDVISKLVEKWREGYCVVFAERLNRNYAGFLDNLFSRAYYALFKLIGEADLLPPGISDFVLLDRKAVDALNEINERARFSKALYRWIGFSSVGVPFVPAKRAKGHSGWGFKKLVRLATDSLIAFSNVPIKIWSIVGGLISAGAIAYALYFLIITVLFGSSVAGFPSLIVSIMFFSGVQLISLGFIGEYIARVYDEVKGRPLYIVAEGIGSPDQSMHLDSRDPFRESTQSFTSPRDSLRGRFRNDNGDLGRNTVAGRGGPTIGNQRDRDHESLAGPSQISDGST